ncbi:glycosyltransferase [Pseudoalteromonas sp. APC 3215]|uniref:glycosyltransferase n=1 Tax=Pseudoalteromonas sp. APC 3215 TaxID=3035179 RepID=UPI0025B558EE|nr:glycosyltransferase [Pseudoalteromonas sp. APC 3215]MDN3396915.1 glycosyltransferase [Pseudoalteromonas sp. APC 3215]
MKVLIVSNMYPDRNPNFEYAGIFVKEQYEQLKNTGDLNVNLYIIDGFKSKFTYLTESFRLYLHLLNTKYDVIHVHYGLSGLFMLINPFKKWRNVVLTLHGGDILISQGKKIQVMLSKLLLKRVGKVITLNNEMCKIVEGYTKNYEVLPCGVDSDLFQGKYTKKERNFALFPGNKNRAVKNYPYFKDILDCYNLEYEPLKIIALDGFSRNEVSELMREAKFLLMTSISEGSPQVIKEAMSSDLVVISTNVGDVQHILTNVKGTCILQDNEAPSIAVKKINKAVLDGETSPGARRERINTLGLNNKEVIRRLLRLYGDINAK